MKALFGSYLALAFALTALPACTVQGSGATSVLYCSPEGLCPPGMICGATSVCVASLDSAAGAADTGAGADGSATDAKPADSVADQVAAETIAPDTTQPDSTQQDTSKPDTIQPDTATTDIVKPDSADAGPPVAVTTADLQSGATSLSCENPGGIVNYSPVILEPAVLTGTPVMSTNSSGKKSALLYLRPATGPTSANYAGLLVVVQAWPVPFTAGSVIQVTGMVQEFFCMTEVIVDSLDSVVAKGTVAVPSPYSVGIGPLVADPEPYEGALVSISGVVVSQPNLPGTDGKYHSEFTVKSGNAELAVYLPYGSVWLNKDQTTTLTAGSKFSSITGHLAYSFGHWVLRPREDADLKSGF